MSTAQTQSPVFLVVVGDEILSGKRSDRHIPKVIELLRARGMTLSEVRIFGDDQDQIAAGMRSLLDRGGVVLSCGGIGATPDDVTRQAVAQALGVPVVRHAEAERLIISEYGEKAFPNRVRMADFPEGSAVIPNPLNRVAGFSIGGVYCVPGFPEMAWPMLEWVLDGPLQHLHQAQPEVELRLRALGDQAGEGDLLQLMEALLLEFPGVRLSSLPSRGTVEVPQRHIEFGIRGARDTAEPAFEWFRANLVTRPGVSIEILGER